MTIHLCGYPAPRRAALAEPVRLAPDGVWRAAVSPRSLVGSYPTVSPLPATSPENTSPAVCFLCHFPSAFAASLGGASCPAVSGLSSTLARARTAVTRPASRILPGERSIRYDRAGSSRTRGSAPTAARAARTRRRPGTRARPPAGGRTARARASGAPTTRSSECPEEPHDLAEDLHVLGIDRLERCVLRLEAHAAVLAIERLHRGLVGRLVVTGERDDDVAVAGVLRPAHHDEVAVEDACLDHRLALHPQHEVALERLRHGDGLLEVLLGEQRSAGGDLPEQRQPGQLDDLRLRRDGLLPASQLEGARLRRVAPQQPRSLEVREVGMHGRRRCQPDRLA